MPADGYILDGAINVNNSVLNGESEECPKSPIVGYKYNRNAKITSDDYVISTGDYMISTDDYIISTVD